MGIGWSIFFLQNYKLFMTHPSNEKLNVKLHSEGLTYLYFLDWSGTISQSNDVVSLLARLFSVYPGLTRVFSYCSGIGS